MLGKYKKKIDERIELNFKIKEWKKGKF